MKNKVIKSIVFVAAFYISSFALFSNIENSEALPNENKKTVDTTCEAVIDGHRYVIGYSNNCHEGSGACIDRDCTGNPVITHAPD